jgi:hypothetical protein
VQKHEAWLRTPQGRRDAGGIYLAFLLPALMGLFAQVGGTEDPAIWRVSFVVVALVGCWSTLGCCSVPAPTATRASSPGTAGSRP